MHALGIPTTRSLALISLPKLPVERERTETACVLTRVAPSFLRIGLLTQDFGQLALTFEPRCLPRGRLRLRTLFNYLCPIVPS